MERGDVGHDTVKHGGKIGDEERFQEPSPARACAGIDEMC